MPPISLRLDGFLYCCLYGLAESARNTAKNCTDNRQMLQLNVVLTLADIPVKHPQGIIFPKRGKRIKLTLSQAAALHTTLSIASTVPAAQLPVLQLLGVIDKALVSYNRFYGYRD